MTGKPRLVLHVGAHKTGTSSLQRVLRLHREDAARLGVIAPAFGVDPFEQEQGHEQFVRDAASGRPGQRDRARAFVHRRLEEAPGGALTLLTAEAANRFVVAQKGAEGFAGQRAFAADYERGTPRYWRRRARFVARLARMLEPFDVEIWMTLRRPDSFCMSMYQQVVRMRRYTGTAAAFAASSHALFDYGRLVRQWARAFGRVRVFVHEDAARGPAGVAGAYLEALGLGTLVEEAERLGPANESMHPYVTEFLRRTNHLELDKRALLPALASRLDRTGWPGARTWALLDAGAREAFNAARRDDCEALRRAHGVPTPGRGTLFDWEVRDARPVFDGLDDARLGAMARQVGLPPGVPMGAPGDCARRPGG